MKKNLYFIHKWLSLCFALPFLILAITGLMMSLEPKKTSSHQKVDSPLPLHQILVEIQKKYPDANISRAQFTPETATLFVRGEELTLVTVYRKDGKILKEENPYKNIFFLSKQIHESFLLGNTGKMIVALCGFFLILVLLSGFFFWLKKSFIQQIKLLFKNGKLSRPRDLHIMGGLFGLFFLLFAGGTGFLIELNTLFWRNQDRVQHDRPEQCTFEQQVSVIQRINPLKGRINFCTKDSPYLTYISKDSLTEFTPSGEAVLTVDKNQWQSHQFYRKHHFVELHGGDFFGPIKTSYRLFTGTMLILLNVTGIILFLKKRRKY